MAEEEVIQVQLGKHNYTLKIVDTDTKSPDFSVTAKGPDPKLNFSRTITKEYQDGVKLGQLKRSLLKAAKRKPAFELDFGYATDDIGVLDIPTDEGIERECKDEHSILVLYVIERHKGEDPIYSIPIILFRTRDDSALIFSSYRQELDKVKSTLAVLESATSYIISMEKRIATDLIKNTNSNNNAPIQQSFQPTQSLTSSFGRPLSPPLKMIKLTDASMPDGSASYWIWGRVEFDTTSGATFGFSQNAPNQVIVRESGYYEVSFRTCCSLNNQHYAALHINSQAKAVTYSSSRDAFYMSFHLHEVFEISANQILQVYQLFSGAILGGPHTVLMIKKLD